MEVFVAKQPAAFRLSGDFEEVCALPLAPGTYLVFAKGYAATNGAELTVELYVHGVTTDEAHFSTPSLDGPASEGTFSLVAAASIPATGGAGAGTGSLSEFRGVTVRAQKSSGVGGAAVVAQISMVALPVDQVLTP
jgi:hypothetical protein